jgi:Lipocalin-like domain
MSKTLREQLVGAWRLVSYVEKDVETGVEDAPMGEKPEGIIMYTPDGYVSAQLCTSGRHNFADGDQYRGTPAEYVDAASSYMAYSGPFYLDETKHMLQHEMNISLFPNWKGQRQMRLSLVRLSLWLLQMGIFDKEYARSVAGSEGEHAYLPPEIFTAETPCGHYQGVTDQVAMSRTPGFFQIPLVPRGSSRAEWLPRNQAVSDRGRCPKRGAHSRIKEIADAP